MQKIRRASLLLAIFAGLLPAPAQAVNWLMLHGTVSIRDFQNDLISFHEFVLNRF